MATLLLFRKTETCLCPFNCTIVKTIGWMCRLTTPSPILVIFECILKVFSPAAHMLNFIRQRKGSFRISISKWYLEIVEISKGVSFTFLCPIQFLWHTELCYKINFYENEKCQQLELFFAIKCRLLDILRGVITYLYLELVVSRLSDPSLRSNPPLFAYPMF